MENKEIKSIDMTAKFSKFQVINKDFTRCRCNVMYTGRNRNHSDITKEALDKFIARKGYANVPVVAHLFKGDDGNYRVGEHDSKIILSSEGIEIIDETVPFGVIPEDCNPSMDLITERSGEQREYFSVDVILWTHRYPIMEAAFSDEIYFNQSMEVVFNQFHMNEEYTVVDDFSMSALCLLNRSLNKSENCEPCFESSRVKPFSLNEDKFRQNFELMLETLKQYETGETPVLNNNPIKKEENIIMDYAKIVEKLSAFTYENVLGETVSKYSLVDSGENSICILDREDYKTYSVDCALVDEDVVIDMDNKVECSLTSKEISEDKNFSIADEVNIATEVMKQSVSVTISQSYAEEYNKKIDELTEAYAKLKSDYDAMAVEYNKYKTADEARLEKEHHAQIDAVVEKYAKKIGRLPKFLCYRAKIDYTKDVADIENELILMAGEAMMDTSKQNFSYTPSVCPVSGTPADKLTHNDRYGNLFDKFITD